MAVVISVRYNHVIELNRTPNHPQLQRTIGVLSVNAYLVVICIAVDMGITKILPASPAYSEVGLGFCGYPSSTND